MKKLRDTFEINSSNYAPLFFHFSLPEMSANSELFKAFRVKKNGKRTSRIEEVILKVSLIEHSEL